MSNTRSGRNVPPDDAETRMTAPAPQQRWRHRLAWLAVVVLVVTLVVVLVLSGYVAAQLTTIARVPLRGSPAALGLQYDDVAFAAREDATALAGWYIYPHSTARRCTVIMVHGQFDNREDPSIKMLDIAANLAQHGYGVFMIDLRAHGASAGQRLSWGDDERRDVLGAVDYLTTQPDTAACIVGLGFSMGGATLINAAAEEPRIRAVVADSSFANLRELLDTGIPAESGLPRFFTPTSLLMARLLYGIDLNRMRPQDTIADIAPRPILIIHGTADQAIPVEHAHRLYATAANPQAELWIVPDVEHVRAYATHPQQYMERVLNFLNRVQQQS